MQHRYGYNSIGFLCRIHKQPQVTDTKGMTESQGNSRRKDYEWGGDCRLQRHIEGIKQREFVRE